MKKKKPFDVRRGGVYMADLGSEEEVVGSEQAGVRPVVATQSNRQNEKSPTVIVAIITSQIKKEKMDCHVILPKIKGLPKQSMVCCEQRRTIDKQRLLSYCCTLSDEVMEDVTRAKQKRLIRNEDAGRKEMEIKKMDKMEKTIVYSVQLACLARAKNKGLITDEEYRTLIRKLRAKYEDIPDLAA